MLFWFGSYLVVVWVLALFANWRPTSTARYFLDHTRLPGARPVLRVVLGLAAVGSAWVAGAEPSYAAGDGGPPGPASTAPTGGSSSAPVLRYAGPVSPEPRLSTPWARGPWPTGLVPPRPRRPRATSPSRSAPATPPPAPPRSTLPSEPAPESRPTRAGSLSEPTGAAPAPVTPRGTLPSGASARRSRRPATAAPSQAKIEPRVGRHRAGSWLVRPGDNLWSIAEATLTDAWGHPPGLRDLAPYWWQVVQLNRPNLPEPADPNLLFPGDRVTLPPLPVAPAQF
jgi:hypothetical protein